MLTMYMKREVNMGSRHELEGAHTCGVWMDGDAYPMHRHEERVARSLAVFAARDGAGRRRGWAARVEFLARRSGILSSRRIAVVR